jgi:hypothetical protein
VCVSVCVCVCFFLSPPQTHRYTNIVRICALYTHSLPVHLQSFSKLFRWDCAHSQMDARFCRTYVRVGCQPLKTPHNGPIEHQHVCVCVCVSFASMPRGMCFCILLYPSPCEFPSFYGVCVCVCVCVRERENRKDVKYGSPTDCCYHSWSGTFPETTELQKR